MPVTARCDPSPPPARAQDAAVDESRWIALQRIPLGSRYVKEAPRRTWRDLANSNDSNYASFEKDAGCPADDAPGPPAGESPPGSPHGAADGFSRWRDHRRRSARRVSVPQAAGGPRWSCTYTFHQCVFSLCCFWSSPRQQSHTRAHRRELWQGSRRSQLVWPFCLEH